MSALAEQLLDIFGIVVGYAALFLIRAFHRKDKT